ncbi:MAG: peptidylprolyl isomerase [Burkholderiales bacterium]|nr:peptidylprolyl isomerase [Burkholderiales bacterium]
MNITKDTVVTLSYTVNAGPGQPPESGQQAYLHGGYGNTFAKLEAALEGQAPGFATTLVLQPEDAFGVRDEGLVRTIPKSEFPPGVKVGGQLRGMTDDGREQVFNVVKIKGPQVLLDGNHPFAGKELRFTLKVLEVRAATPEEVTHGHAHGAHGHHHH